MTVIVGFVGPNCAVMASDTMASEEDQSQHETEKIWEHEGVLFGYSGQLAVKDPLIIKITADLEPHDCENLTRWEWKELLQGAHEPVLKNAYGHFVPVDSSASESARKLRGTLLCIGQDDDGYWLLEINYNNIGSFYDSFGFHTIGSGAIAAQVARGLLAKYEPKGRGVGHLKLIACRTVGTCIDVLGGQFGVGGRPDIWASEDGGPFVHLSLDELAAVQNDVEGWVSDEMRSLDNAFPEKGAATDEAANAEDIPPRPST